MPETTRAAEAVGTAGAPRGADRRGRDRRWVALAIHPQPLFAYSAQRANVMLHARAPFPAQTGPLLDDVLARVSRSPLYDAHRTYHVFLCDTQSLFRGVRALEPARGRRDAGVPDRQRVPASLSASSAGA
jgi:hypothetical protein